MTQTTATLDRARAALESHAWQEAYEGLSAIARDEGLAPEDLELLAEAAWWTAHPAEQIDALERAYAAYLHDGNERRAAYVALHLADWLNERQQSAQAAGWAQRAKRMLETLPEGVEHGYLELFLARSGGDPEGMTDRAAKVLDIGTRYGDKDLQALALMVQGMAKIFQANVDEGMALIDEATVAAVGGELTPICTGIVYCMTIMVCRDVADYKRAHEWTEATTRWCERQAISGFPGHCRVRRAEIMRLRGAFDEAEDEARRAVDELTAFGELWIAAAGFSEVGEIRRRMGDLDGAELAFADARERGNDAQPGVALVQLARGRIDAARASIRTILAEQPMPLARARLLPAQVEIALAAHDLPEAREAAEELRGIAETFDAPLWHASAHQALGAVLVYEDDPRAASAELRRAIRHWTEADLPFEAAQARRWLAIALRAAGDAEAASLELQAARGSFQRLGARLETERCDDLIRAAERQAASRRVARTFVFTDIVGSTNLVETIGDEAWEDVVRWHDETLRTAIEQQGGEVVHTTGDGFFATFEHAGAAADFAVAIQRRLLEHRKEHGFAPQVRIGMHAGEATVLAEDYAGLGVHEAARVGALAEGGEILTTCETVEEHPVGYPLGDERTVSLRGLAQPVRVVSIRWQA